MIYTYLAFWKPFRSQHSFGPVRWRNTVMMVFVDTLKVKYCVYVPLLFKNSLWKVQALDIWHREFKSNFSYHIKQICVACLSEDYSQSLLGTKHQYFNFKAILIPKCILYCIYDISSKSNCTITGVLPLQSAQTSLTICKQTDVRYSRVPAWTVVCCSRAMGQTIMCCTSKRVKIMWPERPFIVAVQKHATDSEWTINVK